MGRQMDKTVGRDNSVLGKTSRDKTAAPSRARGPYKKKKKDDDKTISKTIAAAATQERRLKALEIIMQYGSDADKIKARGALMKAAFPDDEGEEDDEEED